MSQNKKPKVLNPNSYAERSGKKMEEKRSMNISYHTQSHFCGMGKTEGTPCKRHVLRNHLKSEINKAAPPSSTNIE